jgi:hypothetical protein
VQGENWLPGSTVTIVLVEEPAQFDVGSVPVPDSGAWESSFTLPDAPPSVYWLAFIENHERCELWVEETFTIEAPSDTEPPTVSWVKPVGNRAPYPTAGGTAELEVSVTDNAGIQSVEFVRWDMVSSQFIGISTDSSPPYQASIEANTLNMKWNQITAVAVDTAGNRAEDGIFIYRLNPAITLDTPEGSRGTKVTVQGSGWFPQDAVIISLADPANTVAQATVDNEGNFTTTFTIPANAVSGVQKVIAITANGLWGAEASFSVAEPDETPLPETTSYGAIAYSVSLKQSFFSMSDTQEGAEEGAWNRCVEAGKQAGAQFKDDCQSAVWVANGYMSIAIDFSSSDPNTWGTGWGATQAEAENAAMQSCQANGGSSCQIDGTWLTSEPEGETVGGPGFGHRKSGATPSPTPTPVPLTTPTPTPTPTPKVDPSCPKPIITLSSSAGRVGDKITVQGKGWLPGGKAALIMSPDPSDNPGATQLNMGSVPVPDSGEWQSSFSVPDTPTGSYYLIFSEVHNGCLLHVQNLFTVTRVNFSTIKQLPQERAWREPNDTAHINHCGPGATQVALDARLPASQVPDIDTLGREEKLDPNPPKSGTYMSDIVPVLNKRLNTTWYKLGYAGNQNELEAGILRNLDNGYALLTGLRTSGMPGWGTHDAYHIVAVIGFYKTDDGTKYVGYIETAAPKAKYTGTRMQIVPLNDFWSYVKRNNVQAW